MKTNHFNGFNIRVYALCINNNTILSLKEPFAGKMVTKFPGGGLEYGEGTTDCLKREFKEELNLNITVGDAFYIQENFVPSLAKDGKQLVTLYFFATILNLQHLKIHDPNIQEIKWISLNEENPFTLPVDQIVFNKLRSKIL